MSEAILREATKRELLHQWLDDPGTMVIDELSIRHGSVRVDIAIVRDLIHGFELKSAVDNLERLPHQVRSYSRVLDLATIVAAESHVGECLQLLPDWWGVMAVSESTGRLSFREIRPARRNPSPNPCDIVMLLWREELLDALERLGLADGIRSRPRGELQARLARCLDIDILRFVVRHYLRRRQSWPPAERRTSDGD